MTRWAKVPEWLLPALLDAPRDRRGDASPLVAHACWVTIAVKYADYRTHTADVTRAQLARDLDLHSRTVRRALGLLDLVGAATIEDVTARGGQAANRVTLHIEEPRRVRHPLTQLSDPPDNCVTPPGDETAGQDAWGVTHAPPLYSESQLLPEEREAAEEEVWADVVDLTRPREEVVQRVLGECFERIGREPAKVRTLRAAARPPRPGPRVLNGRGTGVPEERGASERGTAAGEEGCR